MNGEPDIATYFREIDDVWYDCIDRWMYLSNTDWCLKFKVEGHYVRIAPLENEDGVSRFENKIHVKNVLAAEDTCLAMHLVSPMLPDPLRHRSDDSRQVTSGFR